MPRPSPFWLKHQEGWMFTVQKTHTEMCGFDVSFFRRLISICQSSVKRDSEPLTLSCILDILWYSWSIALSTPGFCNHSAAKGKDQAMNLLTVKTFLRNWKARITPATELLTVISIFYLHRFSGCFAQRSTLDIVVRNPRASRLEIITTYRRRRLTEAWNLKR